MNMRVTHAHVAVGQNAGNGEVHKNEWNEYHVVSYLVPDAVGDGVTDDTAALQAEIDRVYALGGGQIDLTGYRYLIDSADLNVKSGVFLVGPWLNYGEAVSQDYSTVKSALIVNSSYTIRLTGRGAGVRGLVFLRKGLTTPTNIRTGLDAVAAFAGTAVTFGDGVSATASDCYAGHLTIIGFAQAIRSDLNERPRIEYIFGDCTAGIWLSFCTDMNHISKCHFWPALTAHKSWTFTNYNVSGAANNGSGLIRLTIASHVLVTGDVVVATGLGGTTEANTRWTVTVIDSTHIDLQGSTFSNAYTSGGKVYVGAHRRTGTAYKFTNTVDWGQIHECFQYGYDIGYDIDDSDHTELINCGSDNHATENDPTTIGYRYTNGAGQGLMLGCKSASQGSGVYIGNGLSASQTATIRIEACDFWGAITSAPTGAQFIHGVTGRAIVTGCHFQSAPTTAGIVLDSTFGITQIALNEFDGVTTPFSINATVLPSCRVRLNTFNGCVDAVIGEREFRSNQLPDWYTDSYNTDTRGPQVHYRKGRGTPAAPTTVSLADQAFRIFGDVYNGSAFTPVATYRAVAGTAAGTAGTISTSSTPGSWVWATTSDGAITVTDRMALDSAALFPTTDGGLTLGTSSKKWANIFGAGTNLTGTASGLTAGNVTTNANLTGDVTSVGNASTLVTAQSGAHTWAATQTFTLAPVFTDASGSRTALGLGALATVTPGTGVATALAVNIGTAGSFVVNGGALGTPSSGTATNLTGTAASLTAGNVTTNANLTGPITSSGNATSIASQTGTGTKFVVDTSPTLVTPVLGVATATSIAVTNAGLTARFTNSNDGASSQAAIFEGDRATVANSDTVYVSYFLSDSGGTQKEASRQSVRFTNVTAGSETSQTFWALRSAGTLGDKLQLTIAALSPNSNDLIALGTATSSWSDLFLASGAVINFVNGNVTLTHSTGALTMAGGKFLFPATATGFASFNLPAGTAPSSPVDGDVWREDNTNTGLKIRINGVTKTITVS